MIRTVTKRDGTKEPFDVGKIYKNLKGAIQDFDINLDEFNELINYLPSEIKTNEIQDILILSLKSKITPFNNYNLIAGRLHMHNLHKEVEQTTSFNFKHFKELIEYHLQNNTYNTKLHSIVKNELLIRKLLSLLNVKSDYKLNFTQTKLLQTKFLHKNTNGKIVEYNSHIDLINAILLSNSEDFDKIKKYFSLLNDNVISLATSLQNNLRLNNGNTASCFIGEMPDFLDGIMNDFSSMAQISKNGGGIGWYLGRLRPSNTTTSGVVNSNPVNYWVKIINSIAVAVNQRGISKGAITVALPIWHLDIESFSEISLEVGGDIRLKAFDIFPQIVIDSYFIDKVINNQDFYLFNHYEYEQLTGVKFHELIDNELYIEYGKIESLIKDGKLKHFTKINAKEFWKKLLKLWVEIGDFYITNIDGLNKSNYLKEFATTKCGNLCVESFSLTKPTTAWHESCVNEHSTAIKSNTNGLQHTCSLISINVANCIIVDDDDFPVKFDEDKFKQAVETAVEMLDNAIDLTKYPTLESAKSAKLLRNIGVGLIGVADYMAFKLEQYDTVSGIRTLDRLYEKLAWYAYNKSYELAQEKEPYPAWSEANYNRLLGNSSLKLEKWSKLNNNNFDWVRLHNKIRLNGIRNFYLLAQAPNTRSALRNFVTASYAPPYGLDGTQSLGDTVVNVYPKFIKSHYNFYKTKFEYKQSKMIDVVTTIQKWIDTGVSFEVNFDPSLEGISKFSKRTLEAFKNNDIKALYYSLTIPNASKAKQIEIPDSKCELCAN